MTSTAGMKPKKGYRHRQSQLNALSIAKKWELYGRYTAKTDVSYTVKYLREATIRFSRLKRS